MRVISSAIFALSMLPYAMAPIVVKLVTLASCVQISQRLTQTLYQQ